MNETVAIIGFGASGLMAGSLLGLEAYVLEKTGTAGKKLCLTGGGKCNFTHDASPAELLDAYYEKRNFVRPAIYAFPPEKIVEHMEKLGIDAIVNEEGKIFPRSLKAVDVRNALSNRAGKVFYGEKVKRIIKKDDEFLIFTEKDIYKAGYVLMCTGGNTFRDTGSEGDGYEILKALGHNIVTPRPALGRLNLEDNPLKGAEGITIPLTLTLGKVSMHGSAVITANGISGPVVENFSRYVHDKEKIRISFLDLDREEIKKNNGKAMLKNTLDLPERITESLLGELAFKKIADLSKRDINTVMSRIADLEINATVPSLTAMTTTGGVDTREIDSKTMMSKKVKNLYILGELCDVDAFCGGYSLTWAFASAYLAVQDIRRKKAE